MVCTVKNCGREVKARGLCNKHYLRAWSHGTLESHALLQPRLGPPVPRPHFGCDDCTANPWVHVAPSCSSCGSQRAVVRYSPDLDLWRCIECRADFKVSEPVRCAECGDEDGPWAIRAGRYVCEACLEDAEESA